MSQRELRTFDRFLVHVEVCGISAPTSEDFLAFVNCDRSARRLENLRLAPEEAPIHQAIRVAIHTKKAGASRSCDMRIRRALAADRLIAPYRDLPAFEEVPIEDLRVLARFLEYAEIRRVQVPTAEDYLAFCADVSSSRRLRSLKNALDMLLPGNPAVHVVLADAIERKSPTRRTMHCRAEDGRIMADEPNAENPLFVS